MKKLLLVNTNTEKLPYPVPPLGLCMLASCLEGKYEVQIHDCVSDEGNELTDRVVRFNPEFIGFSIRNIDSTNPDNPVYYVDKLADRFIRPVQKISSAKIILGGSGFSIFPEELMELTGADYGIIGEAEIALPQLLDNLDRGEDLSKINNLFRKGKHGNIPRTSITTFTSCNGRFSEIDRWIDFTPYRNRGAYSVQTKRGCAHACIYCTYPVIEGTAFRTREPSDIAREIEEASNRIGDVMFEFVDSTFNDPKGHAEAICREIIRRKLKVRLRTMGINPGNSSEALFELMMQAGFVQIDATPDTASPAMLIRLRKGFVREEIEKMAVFIKKYDLPTMWFFLFGGPGENEGTVNETLDFIHRFVNSEDLVYMAAGLRIYPDTPLEKIALMDKCITEGQSLLYPQKFYYSKEIAREYLAQRIMETSLKWHNCLPSSETRASPGMLQEAQKRRELLGLKEPMFRTLLRIRKEWMDKGLL